MSKYSPLAAPGRNPARIFPVFIKKLRFAALPAGGKLNSYLYPNHVEESIYEKA
jgi:hypothetical protein